MKGVDWSQGSALIAPSSQGDQRVRPGRRWYLITLFQHILNGSDGPEAEYFQLATLSKNSSSSKAGYGLTLLSSRYYIPTKCRAGIEKEEKVNTTYITDAMCL